MLLWSIVKENIFFLTKQISVEDDFPAALTQMCGLTLPIQTLLFSPE